MIKTSGGIVPDAQSTVAPSGICRIGRTQPQLLCIYLILFCASAFVPAWGQFDSASVLGAIKDPSGSPVSSASVELLNISKGVTATRQTDASGNYEFTNVQTGDYIVTATAAGFDKEQTDRFTVTIGARQRVELTLKVGATSQSVTVAGAASLLETDSSDRGETVRTEEAVNLPLNGRAYADL